MRLFLALPLPERHKNEIARLQSALDCGRAVDPDNLHLTLLFLGEVRENVAEDLNEQLESLHTSLPQLTLGNIGHFGHSELRSIWIGVRPEKPLQRFHAKLARSAQEVSIPLRRRKFVPHVTLVRGQDLDGLKVAKFAERYSQFSLEQFQPRNFTLFRSHLRPEGPIYEPLATYPIEAA